MNSLRRNVRRFVEEGFAGNTTDYYDPRNSLLNQVLDRRLGIPITLSVVCLEVGRRAGVSLEGISIFGDSFTTPSDEVIFAYLQGKLPLALNIVDFLSGGELQSFRSELLEQVA